MTDSPIFAFVLMPVESSSDDVYRIAIQDAAMGVGIRAERLDDQLYREGMLDRIYRQIEAADIIIADLSGRNPNVFYEVGYAHAKDKLCILITEDADAIPFDLRHRRHIVYDCSSLALLREELARHLEWARDEVKTHRVSGLRVELGVSGLVKKSKFYATGELEFVLDVYNDSPRDTTEIHAIYFYLQKGWSLEQDGHRCPSSISDVGMYKSSFQIRPAVMRLTPGAWTQSRFQASRTLANKFEGDEFKDSYRLRGRPLVRLLTSKGNFHFSIETEVTLDDLPF